MFQRNNISTAINHTHAYLEGVKPATPTRPVAPTAPQPAGLQPRRKGFIDKLIDKQDTKK